MPTTANSSKMNTTREGASILDTNPEEVRFINSIDRQPVQPPYLQLVPYKDFFSLEEQRREAVASGKPVQTLQEVADAAVNKEPVTNKHEEK